MSPTGDPLTRTIAFLASIGLVTVPRDGADGFLDAVEIVDGCLHYDARRARSSDLLHEAGHLAVLPSAYRHLANGDLDDLYEDMLKDAVARHPVDSPELRAAMQSGECEASAWAYAAGIAIGLDPDDVIHPDHYDGTGEIVRFQFENRCHFGINGLRHGDMIASVRTYPTMLRWLQL